MQGVKLWYFVPLPTSDGVRVQRGPVGGSMYKRSRQGGYPRFRSVYAIVLLIPDSIGYPIHKSRPSWCINRAPFHRSYLRGGIKGVECGPHCGGHTCLFRLFYIKCCPLRCS